MRRGCFADGSLHREICLCPDKEGITAKRSCLKEGHCSYAFPSGDVKLEILYLQFIFKLYIVNDQKADYNNEEYQCLFLLLHIADVVLVQFYY